MSSMKAARHTRYGPPTVVQLVNLPIPDPGPNEILVRVRYATVNRTDCGFRSAEYVISRFWSGLFRPRFQVLGNEFAGEVAAVGKDVTSFKPGDRVVGYDDIRFGAHATHKIIHEAGPVVLLPDNLTFREAAPLLEGAHYAWRDLQAAGVGEGQHIMIYGASGAIGSAAVQLAKHLRARVTAVCGTAQVQPVRSLGADEVVDYQTGDYTRTTNRYDVIFDAVGKSSFGKVHRLLKPNGIYMSTELGKGGQNIWLALLTPWFSRKKVLFPLPTISKADVIFFRDLAMSGAFKPLIDREYTLDQIVEAYTYVETGQKIGNVLLRC